jgi:hypothetical protein
MRISGLTLGLIAGLLLTAQPVSAQQPDFSGTWVLDRTRSTTSTQTEPSGSVTLVIRQSPSVVSVERREGQTTRTIQYLASGAETVTTVGDDTAKGQMRWEGSTLQINTGYGINGREVAVEQAFNLSADRRELTVDSALTMQHGYELNSPVTLASDPLHAVGKDVYIRQ